MPLIRYAINNPLIANLILVVIVIAGVLSWKSMPQEMFPLIELDRVRIVTEFAGASPEEVERLVTVPVEEQFDGMAEIDTLLSTSSEGLSNVLIKLKPGTDVGAFIDDARSAVDRITDLPDLAERPEVRRMQTRFPVISMALYGDVADELLYDMADEIKQRLLQIPGVASAPITGAREWELWVVVDPQRLAALGVTLGEISQALRQNMAELPGGAIKALEGDIILRGEGVAPTPEAVGRIALRHNARGGVLRLEQVADIELRYEEAKTLARFNGRPSVNLTINKSADASTIDVALAVRAFVDELQQELPPTIRAGVFSDLSVYVKNRLETVKSSAVVGLVLVLLSLYLFLNFRVALITALGIPVSFLVAIIAMNYLGHTINMVSLFAFLIALGMIVDDAIIVTENIYRHMEQGRGAREAALVGAREVFWPVMASTATTIAAFLPVFAIGGTMGAFVAVIPVVVSFALIGSLWEAYAVLPSHAAEMLKVERNKKEARRWRQGMERYLALLRWSVVNRYFMAAATVGVLMLSIAFALTRVPFQLFGHVESGQFFINVEAPNTYSLEDSGRLAARIEAAIRERVGDDELASLLTNVGVTFIDFNTVKFDSKYIQFIVDLKQRKPQGFIEHWVTPLVSLKFSWEGERERSTEAVINDIRDRLSHEPGIQRFSILRPQGGPAGADVEVGVSGEDIAVLRAQSERIADFLKRLPGVHDVSQDLEPGKLEYQYRLNERGRQLGLTQSQIAEAVRTGYQGQEVLHVTRADERIPVRLIYPDSVRHRAESLAQLRLVLPGGGSVYLGDVADIELRRGYSSLRHRDSQRLATVTAEVDSAVVTPLEVTEQVRAEFADLEQSLPGYKLLFLGQKRETSESMEDMKRALFIALTIIFFILAALFRSLLDPLVVMISIPFGFIGVVFGHVVTGQHLQFLSLLGFLALSGIVVNDSLILIDFVKRLRSEGRDRYEAVIEAGRVRLRPILLTSITTFLGISPLIFFATGQAAFLSPMAVSLGFGLLFATVLILVVLPCFYLIIDDLRQWILARFGRARAKEASA